MRYLMDFSYSGAYFSGYQKQKGKRTIQEEIEKVLTSINGGMYVKLVSSGRTDARVNALHQMAHFDLKNKIKEYKIKMALNSYLPSDIYINNITTVNDAFHARYMVKKKTYEYKINVGNYNPIIKDYIYQYCKKLNIALIRKALPFFIGKHDFTTFTSAEDKRSDKIREIYDAYISVSNDIITIGFCANGFLKYQIRNMVGTLIAVGEEKIKAEDINNLFEKKDRRYAHLCAPAEGLTLIKVEY